MTTETLPNDALMMAPRALKPHLMDTRDERKRQDEKWGEQNHPWLHTVDGEAAPSRFAINTSETIKQMVDTRAQDGTLDFAAILLEEVAEAIDAETPDDVCGELVQVAAVALAARQSIMRNGR